MTVDWQTYPSLFSVSQGEEIRGWSPDDSRLVASFNEVIVPSGRAIGHCFLLDQNYQEIAPIRGTNATFSPSVDRIATTSANGLFLMLDGSTGESIAGILGRPMEMVLENPALHFSPDGDWLFVNGDPTVYHRERSEFWYGYYQLPAFWGMVFFLTAMIESIYVGRLLRSRTMPQSEIAVVGILTATLFCAVVPLPTAGMK